MSLETPAPAARQRKRSKVTPGERVFGFAFGVLIWLAGGDLLVGIVPMITDDIWIPIAGIIGAWIVSTRLRNAVRVLAVIVVFASFVIGFSPIADRVANSWAVSEKPVRADAIMVLAADGDEGLEITEKGQARILRGYELAAAGWAPKLLVSRGNPDNDSWIPAVQRQMKSFGIAVPMEATPGVRNTHDEAVACADMAKARGWKSILLVTHPSHMRRALATFRKTGLKVTGIPCAEWRYNLHNLNNWTARTIAFRESVRERMAFAVYRMRGWLIDN